MKTTVGPVLLANEIGWAVAAAIRESRADIEVEDRGSYLRVLAPKTCTLKREAVERLLGRPFLLPSDLENVMPSFTGTFSVGEDEATWTSEARHD